MNYTDDENGHRERSKRLQLIRAVAGFETTEALATRLGVGPQRLTFSMHRGSLHLDVAFKLVELVPALTLDWLYLGRTNGLGPELVQALAGNEGAPV
jgi:hypothetical protein